MFYIRRALYIAKRMIRHMIARCYKPARNVGEHKSRLYRSCEAKALARVIYNIENADWKTRKKWRLENKTRWDLADGIYMEESKDYMCWHLWRQYDDQARLFCKIIPSFRLREECIERLLHDQPWVCI